MIRAPGQERRYECDLDARGPEDWFEESLVLLLGHGFTTMQKIRLALDSASRNNILHRELGLRLHICMWIGIPFIPR